MKFFIGIFIIFGFYSIKSIESTTILNSTETIEYNIIGCFDINNSSTFSTPYYLLQLNEVNETCYQIEKKLPNETQIYDYIAPSRDDGVQIEISVESCSNDFPQINLSLCDDHQTEYQSNQTEFSTESYRNFDSSEEENEDEDQSEENEASTIYSDSTDSSSHHDLHWNFLENQQQTKDYFTETNPTINELTTIETTTTTTTTTTSTTTKKTTKKVTTTKAKSTTETSTTTETTTTSSVVPPKKSPSKSKGPK